MNEPTLDNFFGPNFIQGFARSIISNWEVAIVELVANSYDAGAKNVYISLSDEKTQTLIVKDDGCGMTQDELLKRWVQCGYSRVDEQGLSVYYPDGTQANRTAYGKNGKGRWRALCWK